MLTKCVEKGHIKCDMYWPADMEPVVYGDLQVTILREDISNDWHIREIEVAMVCTKPNEFNVFSSCVSLVRKCYPANSALSQSE